MKLNHYHERIVGFFDFADVYREAVARARDGAQLVEVGCFLGKSTAFLAVEMVNSDKRLTLHCVDHWEGSKENAVVADILNDFGGYDTFLKNLDPVRQYLPVKIHRMPSVAAAAQFADGSLDFVMIDASHDYPSVMADIAAWLPKVKAGGVFAGHDYDDAFMGVIHAVEDSFGSAFTIQGKCWVHNVPTAAVMTTVQP